MTNEEIVNLKYKASFHDHKAEVQLGLYYLSLPISAKNMGEAELWLKKAAEKHDKIGNEELVKFYILQLKRYIERKQAINKINYVFQLGIKWCDIGISSGFDFTNYKKELLFIYDQAGKENKNIVLEYKQQRQFNKLSIIIGSFAAVFLIVFVVMMILRANVEEIDAGWVAISLFIVLTIAIIVITIYKIKNRGKKISELMTTLVADEKKAEVIKEKQTIVYAKLVDYLSSVAKVSNDNKEKLTNDEVGRMGECFVEFCIKKKIRYFKKNLFVAVGKIFPNVKVKGIKWTNVGTETNDPFDFIILLEDGRKLYMDVKTTIYPFNVNIGMSTLEENFAKKCATMDSAYLICRITNFHFLNVPEFEVTPNKIKIQILNFNNPVEMSKFKVMVHAPSNKTTIKK